MDSSLDGAPAAQTVNIPLLSTKRKRTKRLRPHSPPLPPATFTFSPAAADYLRLSPPSPETSTTEELETAKCLLLLSQGFPPTITQKTPAASNSTLYTCKTCNRTFSSFQALGGHRTSHRKTKTDRKSSASASAFSDDDDFPSPNSLSLQLSTVPTAVALKPSPLPRMHECAYCGAEFTSGQALGGHMRKHRGGPIGRAAYIPIEEIEAEGSKKQKSELPPLDLNLPAQEDENQKLGLGRGLREKGEGETGVGISGGTPPSLTPSLIHKV